MTFQPLSRRALSLKTQSAPYTGRSGARQGNILTFDIAGSGFMYNMVRIIAGTLLEIGSGKRKEDSIKRALQSLDRRDAGATALAHGLMLYRVEYPGFDTAKIL